MSAPRLQTESLSRNFGALRAVQNIDFALDAGARRRRRAQRTLSHADP